MGKTSIEWTATHHPDGTVSPGYTFNPVWGCQRVSPGCEHCYAETWATRYGWELWGPAKTTARRTFGDDHWAAPRRWNARAAREGRRRKVFCGSMCDIFEDHPVTNAERLKLWPLIAETPELDWLLLTKRPHRIQACLPPGFLEAPWPNVWLGTSIENQEQADTRIPELLAVPAAVRFLSCEPLLGPVDLTRVGVFQEKTARKAIDALAGGYWEARHEERWVQLSPGPAIHWVIAGGESGGQARPMHPDWARSLRDQCQAAGVAFFFKQWGDWHPDCLCEHRSPCRTVERPTPGGRGVMFRCGKAAGRRLDGREWDEVPAIAQAAAA